MTHLPKSGAPQYKDFELLDAVNALIGPESLFTLHFVVRMPLS